MNKIFVAILLTLGVINADASPSITEVKAQQRYPWNGKVDISYKVSGDIGAKARAEKLCAKVKVFAVDGVTKTEYVATNLTGDVSLLDGTHRIVWDMDADGYNINSTNVMFHVACEVTPGLYCVIDLSGGSAASSYPVSFLDGVPEGGWSDEYKTQKLVLRLVKAGTNPAGGQLDTDTWVSIFELTKGQYASVMEATGSTVEQPTCAIGGIAEEYITWFGRIKSKANVDVRLPSRSEWQYVCRAGTTSEYNNGKDGIANMEELGWYYGNVAKSETTPCVVGLFKPNAWGIFDMHGNVMEWTGDEFWTPTAPDYFYLCGGSYSGSSTCTSTHTDWRGWVSGRNSDAGFRVFATL